MALLLGFLLRSGSLPVLPEELCPLSGTPAPEAAWVQLWEPLEPRREAICRLGRVFVRLGLGLSDV